jgi:hypothetical protein
MRKIFLIIFLSVYMMALTYLPLLQGFSQNHVSVAHAASGGGNGQTGGGGNGQNPNSGGGHGTEDCLPTQLCNPLLSKYDTLCKVLEGLINLVTEIGAIIAVILIIWTGFKFITAQGNTSKLSEAKKAFYTTIIGTAVLLGASVIAQIIVKTVFSITNQADPGACLV